MNQQTKSSSRRRVRLKPTIAHVMLFWMALSTVAYSPTNNRYMHEVASQIRDMDMQRMGQGSPRLRHQTEQDFLGSDQYVDMANSIRRNNFHPPPPPPTDPYEEQLFNVAGPRFQPSSAFRNHDEGGDSGSPVNLLPLIKRNQAVQICFLSMNHRDGWNILNIVLSNQYHQRQKREEW